MPALQWPLADDITRERLPPRQQVNTELVQRFVLGVPVYRQRFSLVAGRPATERFCRLIRTAMAHAKQLREPFEAASNATKPSCARKGKRDWERPARSSE